MQNSDRYGVFSVVLAYDMVRKCGSWSGREKGGLFICPAILLLLSRRLRSVLKRQFSFEGGRAGGTAWIASVWEGKAEVRGGAVGGLAFPAGVGGKGAVRLFREQAPPSDAKIRNESSPQHRKEPAPFRGSRGHSRESSSCHGANRMDAARTVFAAKWKNLRMLS